MDSRLLEAFFAKVRWDKATKDVDRKGLVKLAAIPTIADNLHKLIQVGRRYIRKVCDEVGSGNTIVRRQIMDARYTTL